MLLGTCGSRAGSRDRLQPPSVLMPSQVDGTIPGGLDTSLGEPAPTSGSCLCLGITRGESSVSLPRGRMQREGRAEGL